MRNRSRRAGDDRRRRTRGAADAGRTLDEKAPKTEANRRVLELGPVLTAALRAHRERQAAERRAAGRAWVDHGLVFCSRYGTPLAKGNLLRAFRRLLRLAGLPAHHRVHDLRHTAVQNLLLSGASLPEASGAAGHASPAVTSALYAHAVRRVRAELLGRLGAFYAAGAATDADGGDARRGDRGGHRPRSPGPRRAAAGRAGARPHAAAGRGGEAAPRRGADAGRAGGALRGLAVDDQPGAPRRDRPAPRPGAAGRVRSLCRWRRRGRRGGAEERMERCSAGGREPNCAQTAHNRGDSNPAPGPGEGALIWGEGGSAYGIRTRDLRLERAVS